MKRTAVIILSLMLAVPAFAGETYFRNPHNKPLIEKLSVYGPPVKVFVADVKDSTGKSGDVAPLLKKDLERMLPTRKRVSFEVVSGKDAADIVINTDIVEFFWTDSDPVDNITGIGPILMDAAMKENYGRLQAVFTITDAKTGSEVWEKKIQATITGNQLTPENCAAMLSARMMKVITAGNLKKNVRIGIGTI